MFNMAAYPARKWSYQSYPLPVTWQIDLVHHSLQIATAYCLCTVLTRPDHERRVCSVDEEYAPKVGG